MLDKDKLDALIVWLASRHDISLLGLTKLWKLLYFADVTALRELGHSITGSDYIKYEHGPVPSRGDRAIKRLLRNDDLESTQVKHGNYITNKVASKVSPDLSLFSADEIAIVEKVCHTMGMMTAKALSHASHFEPAWVYADDLGSLSPELMAYGAQEDPEGL